MLLRLLQTGEIRPVGSTRTGRVDVPVIAGTYRNLESAVQRRTFRDDLYYHLCDLAFGGGRVVEMVDGLAVGAEDEVSVDVRDHLDWF